MHNPTHCTSAMAGAVLWYAASLVGSYVWLSGDSGLATLLSPMERAAAAIAVGTVAPSYIAFGMSACLSMLE